MQTAAVPVAKDPAKSKILVSPPPAFLGGEFRRGVQIKLLMDAIRPGQRCLKGMQMGLVAGRGHQRPAFHLGEALILEWTRMAAFRRARLRSSGRRSA